MIYLDTHIALWLYFHDSSFFSPKIQELIDNKDLYISPIVLLEFQYLSEANKISVTPQRILRILQAAIGLRICDKDFKSIMEESTKHTWTRDPFDRIITAQASLDKNTLLTKDRYILTHYRHAVWE